MSYNVHKLLLLAEKFEKATKSLDKDKDKDKKNTPKKRFPFWLKFKKKKASLFEDLLLKYSDAASYDNEYVTRSLPYDSRAVPAPNEGVEDIPANDPSKLKMVWDNSKWNKINSYSNIFNNASLNNKIIAIKEDDNWEYWKLINGKLNQRSFADLYEVDNLHNIIDLNDQEQDQPLMKSKHTNIDPKFQKVLGLNPDGLLGPVTRSALDAYKKSINQENASDALIFEALKNETAYKANRSLVYDDNQNVYKSDFLDGKYKSKLDLSNKVSPY